MDRKQSFSQIYITTFTTAFLIVPTLILVIVYGTIIDRLKRLNRNFLVGKNHFQSESRKKNVDTELYHTNNSYEIRALLSPLDSPKNRPTTSLSSSKTPTRKESTASLDGVCCSQNLIQKRKQTITLCLISVAFFMCQMPLKCFQIFNSLYEFETAEDDDEWSASQFKILNFIFLTVKLMYCLQGLSNPIIYNLMSSKFYRSFKSVIFCKSLNPSGRSMLNDFNRKSNLTSVKASREKRLSSIVRTSPNGSFKTSPL
jgi:hypothetical protein